MIVVVAFYLIMKSTIPDHRISPLETHPRTHLYTSLHQGFAVKYPEIWTTHGPKPEVVPKGLFNKTKWEIIKVWFGHQETVEQKEPSEIDKMGVWMNMKRKLAEGWLGQIDPQPEPSSGDLERAKSGDQSSSKPRAGTVL
jgi:hypothetical protein